MNDKVLFADVPKSLLGTCFGMLAYNDPGHQLPHIRDVARNGIRVAEHYYLDPMPFKLAAVCHDIYSSANRKEHHTLAGEWVRNNFKHYRGLEKYADLVARMCEQHRSSYKGKYTGLFEEGFAAADRGVPTVENSIVRSFQHHSATSTDALEVRINASIAHLQEKFGPGGYNRENRVHVDVFGDALERFKGTVMDLTVEQYIYVLKKHNLV